MKRFHVHTSTVPIQGGAQTKAACCVPAAKSEPEAARSGCCA